MRIPPLTSRPFLGLTLLALVACGQQETPTPQADLQEYQGSRLEAQTISTTAQLFNGLGNPLKLSAPRPLTIEPGTTHALRLDVGAAVKGQYGAQAYDTQAPLSLTGNAYALAYGSGQTMWIPRLSWVPFGLALEQLANLTNKSVVVSYVRPGQEAKEIDRLAANSAGKLLLDHRPGEITYFFKDARTQELLAKETFKIKPGESVAIALYGDQTQRLAIVPGGSAVTPVNTPPVARFSATPNTVAPLAPVVLDASATTDAENDELSYRWELGNGQIATGQKLSVDYAQAGNYTVKLTVTDSKGASSSTTQTVTVNTPITATPAQVQVFVTDVNGTPLGDATVSAEGKSATTSNKGVANLSVPAGRTAVVKVTKNGYLPQSLRTSIKAGTSTTNLTASLLPLGSSQKLNEDAGGTITSSVGTIITLPANAFVNAAGQAVTGDIDVQVTPVDVTTNDINAFPGEGQAVSADGQIGSLLSYGMVDVQVTQNGQPLQLAPGKSAALQMNVTPTQDEKGQPIVEGAKIPLWWFNTQSGLWVEEGLGQIQRQAGKLVLVGSVAHFTTWNFDYKFVGAAQFDLKIKIKDQNGQLIDLTPGQQAYVRIAFGQPGQPVTVKTNSVGPEGVTIINAPPSTPMTITAWFNNQKGTLNSNTSTPLNTVIIDTPYTSDVFLSPATQTVTFNPNGALVTLTGEVAHVNFFKITGPDGIETLFYIQNSKYKRCGYPSSGGGESTALSAKARAAANDPILFPCVERADQENQYRLHFDNITASYQVKAEVQKVDGTPFTTNTIIINYVKDPNYTPQLVVTPNPLEIAYGPRGGKFTVEGSYGYLPTIELNGTVVTECADSSEPPLPCISDWGNELGYAQSQQVRAAAYQINYYLRMPDQDTVATLTVKAAQAATSIQVKVAKFNPANMITPSPLIFSQNRLGLFTLKDLSKSYRFNGSSSNFMVARYTPRNTSEGKYVVALRTASNTPINEALNFISYKNSLPAVSLPTTANTASGFIPPVNLPYNTQSHDMSQGSTIPFLNRTWSLSRLSTSSSNNTTINPNTGMVTVNNYDYGVFLIKVSNSSNPTEYIEGLLLIGYGGED